MSLQSLRLLLFVLILTPLSALSHPDHESRISRLSEAITNNPDEAKLYLARAELRSRHGEFSLAEQDFLKVEALHPSVELQVALGHHYLRSGDIIRAEAAYDRAVTLQSNSAAAWLGKAKVAVQRNDDSAALLAYEKYFSIEDNPQPGYFLGAATALAESHPEAAIRIIRLGVSQLGEIPSLVSRLARMQP